MSGTLISSNLECCDPSKCVEWPSLGCSVPNDPSWLGALLFAFDWWYGWSFDSRYRCWSVFLLDENELHSVLPSGPYVATWPSVHLYPWCWGVFLYKFLGAGQETNKVDPFLFDPKQSYETANALTRSEANAIRTFARSRF
jgi:hypothetical protein